MPVAGLDRSGTFYLYKITKDNRSITDSAEANGILCDLNNEVSAASRTGKDTFQRLAKAMEQEQTAADALEDDEDEEHPLFWQNISAQNGPLEICLIRGEAEIEDYERFDEQFYNFYGEPADLDPELRERIDAEFSKEVRQYLAKREIAELTVDSSTSPPTYRLITGFKNFFGGLLAAQDFD